MNDQLLFAGISGSLRKDSFNSMLLQNVGELLPAGVTLRVLPIADIPLYNADFDTPDAPMRPDSVQQFRDQLAEANAIVIVSPEYNYSIPGGLKNAIDWASRGEDSPLIKKPIALMGVTQGLWGTTRMQQEFHPLFQYLDMKPVYKPEIFVAQAKDKFDETGRLKDEKTKELIRQKLQALKELAQQVKRQPYC